MEHAIERAAELLNAEGACCGDCGREPGAPLSECPACERFLTGYARALADAGLLAPAPLREEWGRAYRKADGVLFVDDQDGSFRDSDDVAQFVPPQHPDSPYDLIVKRGATDWIPVARAEGDGRADQ